MPGEGYLVVVGLDGLSPEGEGVAFAAKFGVDDLEGLVGELGEEQAFDLALQPASEGDVVGVDADAVGEVAT